MSYIANATVGRRQTRTTFLPSWCARAAFSWLGATALLILGWAPPAHGQMGNMKITRIEIRHVGPASVSDAMIRANIRTKPGDPYLPAAVDDDVRNLYATGLFYNVQVATENSPQGMVLAYIVQGNPRLTDIKFKGNKKYSDAKLRKKITAKPGEPFNERKLFTDAQEIEKMYQKAGYPRTDVKYTFTIDEITGRATATFEITESLKVKIVEVDFVGTRAFKEKKLRKEIKTRKHWMFSWLTGSGFLKDEQFEEDKEKLAEFYRDHGYLDFEIKRVDFVNPTARTMVVRLTIYEGTQYRVGAVRFTGNKVFGTPELIKGLKAIHGLKGEKSKLGPNGLPMDLGDPFTPKGLAKDIEEMEDFYGSKGYIDVTSSSRNLIVVKIPNVETGTIDLEFKLDEGQKSYIERIDIRGNSKTKDKVIRRELAVSPGETFDMVRVKLSKQRLEGLQFFEKVDARPEPTEVPNRKNLVVGVDEKNTGNLTLGAGFSSVDALVGFVEFSQGNFDLFHPPTFTGGGQKLRLRVQMGTEEQAYTASFIEPWFLGRKLALGVDLYYQELAYESIDTIYNEVKAGGRVSLTRALGSDFLIGSVHVGVEDIGILLNSGYGATNTPADIMQQVGYSLLYRMGGSLAYDTRNSVRLPDKGQRTELSGEYVTGGSEFYKLGLTTSWYFKGLAKGHVLELVGRTGVAQSLDGTDVPFYDRYYLGGLYSLRGFKYHSISPRDPNYLNPNYPYMLSEPIGGDSFWFGCAEYSLPIFEQEHGIGVRFAVFYDVGAVMAKAYDYANTQFYNDNWGVGIRLNLPIGPLRLDYGIPIHHDQFNSGSGQFQFGVGYTREF
jgi:outer membrane protein insertion porin family